MDKRIIGSFAPFLAVVAVFVSGCAASVASGSEFATPNEVSSSPAVSESPVPLTLQCETPDAGLLAAMTSVATAATLPGSTLDLINPSVVDAGAGRQAVSFSWIGHSGDTAQQGPLNTYLADVGNNDPSTWQEIPYDTAIVDPYGKHPELSVDDENALLAAHAALGCTMGG